MTDRSEEYRGYRFWLVETTALRQRWWRIEHPSGFRTPPLPFPSEADVKAEIDKIIAGGVNASA